MVLWCDKYRPTDIKKMDGAESFTRLVKGGDFPHLMFYGPSGAGKKTLISCLLREIFGTAVTRVRPEHQVIQTPSKKKIEVQTVASNHHIEVCPSDSGVYDRFVITEMIKQHASTRAITATASGANGDTDGSIVRLKVVVITEADRLTREAQQALRRTMEKYSSSCRIILSCEQASRILPAVKSRTLQIRVPAPSIERIAHIIADVSQKESRTPIDVKTGQSIAHACGRNLRRALLVAETMVLQKAEAPLLPQWHSFVKKIAQKMLHKQTPQGIEEIRTDLFQIMAFMIPTDLIFELLVKELLPLVNEKVRVALIQQAAFYDHRSRHGNKGIIHLEAFVAQFMIASKQ